MVYSDLEEQKGRKSFTVYRFRRIEKRLEFEEDHQYRYPLL